jgi:hypothetical protein
MSRGRKERTPAQLAVLAQAREKAKIVIAERAKLNALAKKDEPVAVSDEAPREPEPLSVLEDPASESEDEEPRLTRREVGEMSQRPSPKYQYINGMYIKIK